MNGPASRVAYDQEAQVIGVDTSFAKRQVFQNCIVLTVSGSLFNSSEWRRPEIVNAVLVPITGGPDTQVHRTIDLSQSGAARALATKLNELQQPSRCWRARIEICTTGRKRLLLRINAGQHIPPFRGDPACDYIRVRRISGLHSRAQEAYQQHRGYVLQDSHEHLDQQVMSGEYRWKRWSSPVTFREFL